MSLLKTSSQRALRKTLLEALMLPGSSFRRASCDLGEEELMVQAELLIENILPKKGSLMRAKCTDVTLAFLYQPFTPNVECALPQGTISFFTHFDENPIPSLRTLHVVPYLLPQIWVDQGAVKFLLSGADIMCPGLLNSKHSVDPKLASGTIVVSLSIHY